MKPIEFPGVNHVFAKDQPEYQPLPVMHLQDRAGSVISCWQLTDQEREEIAKTGKLYIKVMTFGHPLQPILPTVDLADGIDFT